MHRVTLTWEEWRKASELGTLRRTESQRLGYERQVLDGEHEIPLVTDIFAAAAEIAGSKCLGLPLIGGVNRPDLPDIAPDIEVRSTMHPVGKGRLILRPSDNLKRPFVLVCVERLPRLEPQFAIVGWIRGLDGARDEWLYDKNGYPPCWMVPQDVLTNVAYLIPLNEEGPRNAVTSQQPVQDAQPR